MRFKKVFFVCADSVVVGKLVYVNQDLCFRDQAQQEETELKPDSKSFG